MKLPTIRSKLSRNGSTSKDILTLELLFVAALASEAVLTPTMVKTAILTPVTTMFAGLEEGFG